MNKQAYRVIFNVRRGALMAVAENVSSQGKSPSESAGAGAMASPARTGSMRLAQLGVMIAVLFGGVTVVHAQIVADRNAASRPVVDQSANGKPVVQIVTPNAAGVSHNRYDQFNVGQGGAILNNSNAVTQTQQAGYINGNAALANGSARMILNEVTGASRSQLNGYIEVAGQRADVIVANPNGISCSGCGFINTSRGVLTTGTPEFAADGSLSNLRVTRGDITIDGSGLNGAGIDRVDLIARSLQVNGQLWGDQLNVVTGANLVNYANLGVQVIQGQGSAPTVSIDLAQLGGMYANKIRLVGTEAGVGVRSLGTIAAQAGDISLDNSGKVTLNGSTTASGNIAINSQGDVSNGGNLYAQKAVQINAAGSVSNTGVLAAQTDVTVQAHDIASSNSIAAGVDASGNAAANGNLSLTATAGIDNTGGNLYAKDTLTARAGADLTNANGVIRSGNSVDVAATGALTNIAGRIEANGSTAALALAAASLDNSGGRIANSGTGLTQIDGGAQIVNANAARVANGGVIGGNGNVQLRALAMNNNLGGQINVGTDLSLQFATLSNTGDISATRDLSIAVTNSFANAGTGTLNAVRNLSLTADSVDNKGLINAGATTVVRATTTLNNTGRIYGEDVALGAQTFTNNVDPATNIAGVVASRNSMQIGAAQVSNSEHALLQSLGDMTIAGALDSNNQATGSATSIINESATIDAGGALNLQTASLINRNNHFSTTIQDDPALTRHVTQYANWAAPDTWYNADQVTWSDSGGGGIVLVIPDGNRFEQFYKRDYTEVVQKTIVLSSDPGRISSGGNMLLSGNVTNDKSLMVAGGTLSGSVGAINNIGATGTETTVDHMTAGENYYHWVSGHPHTNYYTYNQGGAAYDNVLASTTMDLSVASVQQNTAPATIANAAANAGRPSAGSGVTATPLPHLVIPNNGLFHQVTQPGLSYDIATDPKFTDYKTFVSSDYMLSRLALDPQTIQKRLGDGFYEQKMIGDQITELTGKRTLAAYATAEDQYKALMDAGVATAARFQLTPGIALTDAQMAALTSDIVWLVSRQVTLPDGTQTSALVPVVYLGRASAEDISPSGSLVSAKDINLTVNGSLNNGGTLLASNGMIVQATDIKNTGSIQSSDAIGAVSLVASNDVTSSGSISGNRVGILAGRDVTLETTTASNMATDGLNTKIDQVSSINAGQLTVQAGRDVNLAAAAVNTTGSASFAAGRNVNSTAVKTQESYNVTFNSDNHLNESSTQVFGTAIATGGALTLSAAQDINTQAAYANAGGALTATAGRDINLGAAQQGSSVDQAIYTTSKGLFSSSSFRAQRSDSSTTSVGSTLSGDTVNVQAGNNLNVIGSSVVGTGDVSLNAVSNVNIVTSQNTSNSRFEVQSKKSGLFASGLTLSLGSSSQNQLQVNNSVTNNASTVGSTGGNVTITAGKDAAVSGSNEIAGKAAAGTGGNISITAQNITIDPSQDIAHVEQSYDIRQRGIGLTLVGTPYDTLKNMLAIGNGGGSKAQKVKAAGDEMGASALSTPQLALTIGSSSSSGFARLDSITNNGSTLTAAGDLRLTATGNGSVDASGRALDGNISIQGSQLTAGGAAVLNAANNVNIVAATNSTVQDSSTSSSSSSINFAAADWGTLGRSLSGGPNQGGTSMSPIGVAHANGNGSGVTSTQVSSSIGADSIAINSRTGDIIVAGTNITGNNDVFLLAQQGKINISAGQNEQVSHQDNNSTAFGNLGSSNNGTATTVGYRSTSDTVDSNQQLQNPVRSRIVSNNGNVSVDAKQDLNIRGTDISAANNLTLIGQNVSLDAGTDTSQKTEAHKSNQIGVTMSVGGVAGQITQVTNAALAAQASGDSRLTGLYGAQAGIMAATAAKGITTDGTSSPQLVKVTVALGTSNSESQSNSQATQQQGSTLAAGNSMTIVATGNGQTDTQGKAVDGDINLVGTQVSGKDVSLVAARDINAISATDTTSNRSSSNSSGASIGVGVALGGDQNGFTLELGATKTNAVANGESTVNHNTHITASDTLSVTTGRDANLLGAQLRGDTITADVGRNLNIASQQDSDTYHSQQNSEGVGVSLCIPPFCFGNMVSASGSVESGNIDSTYKSVNEQSGIYAGKGGYDIHVNSNTDLKGSVIASAATADKNKLTTGTLTTSDIENKAEYSASNGGASLSVTTGKVGVAQNVLNNVVSNLAANSQNPQQGNAESTTKSAISNGTVVITDAAGQQQKTGQTAEQTIAGINHDTANASAPIDKIFDLQKIQRDQEVAKATSQLAQQIAPLLYEKVGDWLKNNNADTPTKVAVHALIGGLMTKAMGGEFGTGAAGAAAAKLALEVFGDQLADIEGISKEDTKALEQLLGLVIAKAVTQISGGSASDGNASGTNIKLATEFNRQLHPTEERMIKENAARFAKEIYKTDNPTPEQIAGATSLLANTAQNLVDNNLGYNVPYSVQAEMFLHTLQKEYAMFSPNLSIGDGQYLFYATPEQKNQTWLNTSTSDKYIAGIIIKAPIKPADISGVPNANRDKLTGLPLDEMGRYSQQIGINGQIYTPKYFPCATPECLGHNLDTSDPGTQVYIKAMQKKAFDDIGTAATITTIVTPVGPIGATAGAIGPAVSIISGMIDDQTFKAIIKEGGQILVAKYLTSVYKFSEAMAIRITATIDMAGGWQAFLDSSSAYLKNEKNK